MMKETIIRANISQYLHKFEGELSYDRKMSFMYWFWIVKSILNPRKSSVAVYGYLRQDLKHICVYIDSTISQPMSIPFVVLQVLVVDRLSCYRIALDP